MPGPLRSQPASHLPAESCREAQLRCFCSCRKITPEPDLWALGPAPERALLLFGSGMFVRKRISFLAAVDLDIQEFVKSHQYPHWLSLFWPKFASLLILIRPCKIGETAGF